MCASGPLRELSREAGPPVWRRELQAAWAHPAYADAKRALDRLARELRLLSVREVHTLFRDDAPVPRSAMGASRTRAPHVAHSPPRLR